MPPICIRGDNMITKKVYKYLISRNKRLEEELSKYKKEAESIQRLSKELASIKSEFEKRVNDLKKAQEEYAALIREAKILKKELLKPYNRRDDGK